jgi:DNA polymerase III subunit beta
MRFSAEAKDLLAAVKRASSVVEARNTIPILGCLRIEATDTGLRLSGTCLDTWITVSCRAAVSAPGAICADAALLSAWLGAVPKGALVQAEIENGALRLTAGRMQADIRTLGADMFPMGEKTDGGTEVPGAAAGLAVCLPFAGSDESRPWSLGVAVTGGHFVGFDGHRLCAIASDIGDSVSAVIPAKAARLILSLGPGARVWLHDATWRAEAEGCTLAGKLLDVSYPDWARVAASAIDAAGGVDADAFAAALLAVLVASVEKSKAVKVACADEKMTLSCQGPLMNGEAVVTWDGAETEFAVNAKYMQDALGPFIGQVACIEANKDLIRLTCEAIPGLRVMVAGIRA